MNVKDSQILIQNEIIFSVNVHEQLMSNIRFFCQRLFSKMRQFYSVKELEFNSENFFEIKEKFYDLNFRYQFFKNVIQNLINETQVLADFQKYSFGNIFFSYENLKDNISLFKDFDFRKSICKLISVNHKFLRHLFEKNIFKYISELKSKKK